MSQTSIEQAILALVDSPSDTEFEDAFNHLIEAGESAIAPLFTAINQVEGETRHTLVSVLCEILVEVADDDALELLAQLIYSDDNTLFTPAVQAIARLQLPQINSILGELLDHPAPQVRRVVAWQLGRNLAEEETATLVDHLNDVDIETLRGIIWSLGKIGDPQVIPAIYPFLNHFSKDIVVVTREAVNILQSATQAS